MRKIFSFLVVGVLAANTLVIGQGAEVARILAAAHEAMGGNALAAITSLAVTGRTTRVQKPAEPGLAPDGAIQMSVSNDPMDFEIAIELPDKFAKKDVVTVFSGQPIMRTAGFNGDGLIEKVDAPADLFGGGNGHVMVRSPSGTVTGLGANGVQMSGTSTDASRSTAVLAAKQEFGRWMLGLLADSYPGYPLTLTYGGQAKASSGNADVILATGAGDFKARLFLSAETHLPVMLTWMDKEPNTRTVGTSVIRPAFASGDGAVSSAGGGQAQVSDGRGQVVTSGGDGKQAATPRRMVEYRIVYSGVKTTNGLRLPTKMQKSIDGLVVEDMSLDKIAINPKIDPAKFATAGKISH